MMCVLRFFVLYMRDGWVGEFGGGVRVDWEVDVFTGRE